VEREREREIERKTKRERERGKEGETNTHLRSDNARLILKCHKFLNVSGERERESAREKG